VLELALPLITAAIALPLSGAATVGQIRSDRQRKAWAVVASALSATACLEALRECAAAGYVSLVEPWLFGHLFVDALSAAPLALFALVSCGVISTLSYQDCRASRVRAVLLIQAGTLAAYAAGSPLLFVAGWIISSAAPFVDRPLGGAQKTDRLPALALTASTAFLIAGLVYMSWSARSPLGVLAHWSSFETAADAGGMVAFALLMLAVFFRKGLFPAHSWVVAAHEHGGLAPAVLVVSGHLAAFLILRVVIPVFPAISSEALILITDLALFTALYCAVLALSERSPRRILALLVVSQSSFVLAGLETGTPEGVSGALVYWMVVTVATTSLAVVLRALEQRLHHPASDRGFLGLAGPFPRLATFFIVTGVALVGMPGMLGFIADELLLHGALASHPRLGLVMPLAAALNAFHLFRLFSRLFLGSPGPHLAGVPDARWGERLALTAGLILLILGGLLPAQAVGLRSAAADAVVNRLGNPSSHGD